MKNYIKIKKFYLNIFRFSIKGRSILFNHFIDIRTTVNLSISFVFSTWNGQINGCSHVKIERPLAIVFWSDLIFKNYNQCGFGSTIHSTLLSSCFDKLLPLLWICNKKTHWRLQKIVVYLQIMFAYFSTCLLHSTFKNW